jgi:hypothetical protein
LTGANDGRDAPRSDREISASTLVSFLGGGSASMPCPAAGGCDPDGGDDRFLTSTSSRDPVNVSPTLVGGGDAAPAAGSIPFSPASAAEQATAADPCESKGDDPSREPVVSCPTVSAVGTVLEMRVVGGKAGSNTIVTSSENLTSFRGSIMKSKFKHGFLLQRRPRSLGIMSQGSIAVETRCCKGLASTRDPP